MQVRFHPLALIAAAWLTFGPSCVHAQQTPPVGKTDELIGQLTSEDPKLAESAKQALEAMGAEVVPVLFAKLLTADWTLKPRLLEVLSAHGREFAKKKLLTSNDTEKIYAALVYELTRGAEPDDYGTLQFAAMIESLLRAIKSDDKYLRAAAGLAVVYDRKSTVFFDHFHEVVPALLSSFDTELVIKRRAPEDPSDVLLAGICFRLDGFIGDRLAYAQTETALWAGVKDFPLEPNGMQRTLSKLLPSWRPHLDTLRQYWQTWWDDHKNLSTVAIGRIIIERNISFLEAANNSGGYQDSVVVSSLLELWTRRFFTKGREARTWWTAHKDTYQGPKG
jgi:hypothetical protein